MIVFLNGEFVPEAQAVVSVFDRSFLYGDGLFETLRVYKGKPFRSRQHVARLERGAKFLNIKLLYDAEQIKLAMKRLVKENGISEGVIRMTLSRGVGVRGYSPRGAEKPTLVIATHHFEGAIPPEGWKLVLSSYRVAANDPVAMHKTCSKLPNVLARAEAEWRHAEEALILTTDGNVAEASGSNLFWITKGEVRTTPVRTGILPGVTREFVIELCRAQEIGIREEDVIPEELYQAEGVFLTLSTLGIVEVSTFENHTLARSEIVSRLIKAYGEAVEKETTDDSKQ